MKRRKPLKRLKYATLYIFVKILIFWSTVLPRTWVQYFYGSLGRLAYFLVKKEREKTLRHLHVAYGEEKGETELKRLSQRVFVMIGRNFTDILRCAKVSTLEEYNSRVTVEGQHHLDKAYDAGKGVICLTCHMGAFELLAGYFGMNGYAPLLIGTALKDKKLNDLLVGNRSRWGAEAIERGTGTVRIVRKLKKGGMMCLLIDQDTKVKSRFVDFFGKPAATPIGATVLALKTGAKVVPVHTMLDDRNRQVIHIGEEVELSRTGDEQRDLIENTQRFSTVLESFIRKDPSQWLWMHERWKTKPGDEIR